MPPTSDGFARDIDRTIFKISIKLLASKAEAQKLVADVPADVDIKNIKYSLEGMATANSFTVLLEDAPSSAALHVRKVLDGQRLGNMAWRKHYIKSSEKTSDGSFDAVLVLVNADKNAHIVETEDGDLFQFI